MHKKIIIGIIGGISIIVSGIPIYNYYILPTIRHKEMIDKIDGFDKRLKELEKKKIVTKHNIFYRNYIILYILNVRYAFFIFSFIRFKTFTNFNGNV